MSPQTAPGSTHLCPGGSTSSKTKARTGAEQAAKPSTAVWLSHIISWGQTMSVHAGQMVGAGKVAHGHTEEGGQRLVLTVTGAPGCRRRRAAGEAVLCPLGHWAPAEGHTDISCLQLSCPKVRCPNTRVDLDRSSSSLALLTFTLEA